MRSADIKIGETYAIGTTSRSRHRRSAPRPGVVKAVNVKRRKTTDYGYAWDGVIVDVERYSTTVQEIVMPAQVRMTWADWEAKQDEERKLMARHDAKIAERDAKRYENLTVVAKALADVLPEHKAVTDVTALGSDAIHHHGGIRLSYAEVAKLLGVDLPYPEV